MAELDHYDVVIIGSGAGGGTLAWKLAPSGKRILLLERGPYLPRERDNWETSAVFVRAKYHCTEEWLDEDGNEFSPEQNYYVGGNTKFYGAALFRLRPEDFGVIQHHGGLSPAWPLSYQDFEPYLRRGRASLPRARGGRRGSHRGPTQQRVPLSGRAARTPHPGAARRPGEAGAPPLASAARGDARPGRARRTHPRQRLHPLQPSGRVPLPGQRQGGRPGRLRRPGARAPQPDAR